MTKAFPFHEDCYKWPRVAVFTEDEAAELNVHCLYHPTQRRFSLVGFIGVDREQQIGQVINLAEEVGAEVKIINGIGFAEEIINRLMATMVVLVTTRLALRCFYTARHRSLLSRETSVRVETSSRNMHRPSATACKKCHRSTLSRR